MTNIDDLLEKVKGDRLDSNEFVRLVTAVKENQDLVNAFTIQRRSFHRQHPQMYDDCQSQRQQSRGDQQRRQE